MSNYQSITDNIDALKANNILECPARMKIITMIRNDLFEETQIPFEDCCRIATSLDINSNNLNEESDIITQFVRQYVKFVKSQYEELILLGLHKHMTNEFIKKVFCNAVINF